MISNERSTNTHLVRLPDKRLLSKLLDCDRFLKISRFRWWRHARSRTGVHHSSAERRTRVQAVLSFLESILFSFIEQVRLATSQIHDLRATISILLQQRALFEVVRVRNAGASTDHTSALVRAVVAFIANSNQCARPHVRVTDHAFTVALLAEASFW